MKRAATWLAFCAASLMSGCAQIPWDPLVDVEAIPEAPPAPAVANGSLYQPQVGMISYFEDRRPRQVGDVLTVELNEEVNASKSASSNASRGSSTSVEIEEIAEALAKLQDDTFDISGSAEFAADGGARANNKFTGTITVQVRKIYPNGNMFIAGEKSIAINQGTEHIRFSGTVNPRHISSRNSVFSSEVADARIEYVGDGYIHETQHMGWLQRLWINITPF